MKYILLSFLLFLSSEICLSQSIKGKYEDMKSSQRDKKRYDIFSTINLYVLCENLNIRNYGFKDRINEFSNEKVDANGVLGFSNTGMVYTLIRRIPDSFDKEITAQHYREQRINKDIEYQSLWRTLLADNKYRYVKKGNFISWSNNLTGLFHKKYEIEISNGYYVMYSKEDSSNFVQKIPCVKLVPSTNLFRESFDKLVEIQEDTFYFIKDSKIDFNRGDFPSFNN